MPIFKAAISFMLPKLYDGEGNGNPLQCFCLENPRDGGAWWAAVYGVTQSRTQLKWLSSSRLLDPLSAQSYLKQDFFILTCFSILFQLTLLAYFHFLSGTKLNNTLSTFLLLLNTLLLPHNYVIFFLVFPGRLIHVSAKVPK